MRAEGENGMPIPGGEQSVGCLHVMGSAESWEKGG